MRASVFGVRGTPPPRFLLPRERCEWDVGSVCSSSSGNLETHSCQWSAGSQGGWEALEAIVCAWGFLLQQLSLSTESLNNREAFQLGVAAVSEEEAVKCFSPASVGSPRGEQPGLADSPALGGGRGLSGVPSPGDAPVLRERWLGTVA